MERLTEHYGDRYIRIKGCTSAYLNKERKSAPASNAVVRLAAYEDTGLAPEQILGGKELAEIACAMNLLKRYQTLGTVEELTALVKARDVIVKTADDREYIDYICPKCRDIISQQHKGQKIGLYQPKHHDSCGQRLDWSRAEAEAALNGGGGDVR